MTDVEIAATMMMRVLLCCKRYMISSGHLDINIGSRLFYKGRRCVDGLKCIGIGI